MKSKIFNFQIWQLKRDQDLRPYRSASLRCLQKQLLTVDPKNYTMVYAAAQEGVDDIDTLEALYERFNVYAPIDYRGHMMSVSDVVVLDQERAYYCDSIGWEPLPDWQR